ncbi:alpha/beta fold hydrolase [Saccharicrinis sp. FJH2]|uniref:alpha/beta fold hydrolase n=1 Tax=Saccharicrinis sp. FJH65 TaxID=3344659 RepID=UPI0035F275DE
MKKILMLILPSLMISLTVFCQEDGFIETDNGVIHYKKFGTGEPLLIINGGPGLDCEGFTPLAELLSDKYMTILYDQRGTGKSELKQIDSTTVTMSLMAKDMETIRNYFKIDKWIVLGHSFGGFMAEYYATYYPESIKAMILSSTGGIDLKILDYFKANIQIRLSQTERDSLKYWSNEIKQGDTSYIAKYNKARYLASAYLYNKEYIPKLAQRLAFGGYPQITSLVYKDLFKINFDCKESLKDFAKPVLIIQGRQDLTGDGVAYEAHLILKNSSLVFINKSGHYSWWEQEEQYKSEVRKFIASLD